jgi:hypothetical protein
MKYNIELILKKEDKVYLLRRNINIKRLSNKLDYKKLELFKISKVVGLVNYYLELLKIINIYLIFYISFLELVLSEVSNILYTEIELVNLNTEYKVEEILDQKYIRGKLYYLIK